MENNKQTDYASLYDTDMKHIEANLEKFIQKKEEALLQKRKLEEK